MVSLSAYLLVTHGSRDPRPQIAVEQLARLVDRQLMERSSLSGEKQHLDRELGSNLGVRATAVADRLRWLIGTAALELAPLPLHQSIQQFAQQALSVGLKQIQIVPLFLLPGVHVTEDIPAEVALARRVLGEQVKLHLQPYLGSHSRLAALLKHHFSGLPTEARILLAHGSRLADSNQVIEAIAARVDAVVAYWSVAPSLPQKVETLVELGYRDIAILPYFLFAGGITEAIAQQVEQLQLTFPQTRFLMGEPLGATPELARLIVAEMGV